MKNFIPMEQKTSRSEKKIVCKEKLTTGIFLLVLVGAWINKGNQQELKREGCLGPGCEGPRCPTKEEPHAEQRQHDDFLAGGWHV